MLKIIFFLAFFFSMSECGYWEDPSDYDGSPVFAGEDNLRKYYVIQGDFNGQKIPGKWSPEVGAYVSYDGKEHKVESFKVNKYLYCKIYNFNYNLLN